MAQRKKAAKARKAAGSAKAAKKKTRVRKAAKSARKSGAGKAKKAKRKLAKPAKTTRRKTPAKPKKAAKAKRTKKAKATRTSKSARASKARAPKPPASSRAAASTPARVRRTVRAPIAPERAVDTADTRAYSSFQYELAPPPRGGEGVVVSVSRALLELHAAFLAERQQRTARTGAAADGWRAQLIATLGQRSWNRMRELSRDRRYDNYGLGPLLGQPDATDALAAAREAFQAEAAGLCESLGIEPQQLDALFTRVRTDVAELARPAEASNGVSFARSVSSPEPHRAPPYDGSTCDWSDIWILGGGEVKLEPKTDPVTGQLGLGHLYLTGSDGADFDAFDLEVPCSLGVWLQPERSGRLELEVELESRSVSGRVSAAAGAPWASHGVSQAVEWSVEVFLADEGGLAAELFESMHGPGWRRDFPGGAEGELQRDARNGATPKLDQTDEFAAFGDLLGLTAQSEQRLERGSVYYVQVTTRQRHVALSHDVGLSSGMDNCWAVRSIQHNLW